MLFIPAKRGLPHLFNVREAIACVWSLKNPSAGREVNSPPPMLTCQIHFHFIPSWNVSQWSQSSFTGIFEMTSFLPRKCCHLGSQSEPGISFYSDWAVSGVNSVFFHSVPLACGSLKDHCPIRVAHRAPCFCIFKLASWAAEHVSSGDPLSDITGTCCVWQGPFCKYTWGLAL